jgi:hypothetical protein
MTVYDALCVCPEVVFVHVSTFEVCDFKPEIKQIFADKIIDTSKQKRGAFGAHTNGTVT